MMLTSSFRSDLYSSFWNSMNINNWELMIPLAFFAGTGYAGDLQELDCQIAQPNESSFSIKLIILEMPFYVTWYLFVLIQRVRVAIELGAGNSRGAKFATGVSIVTSTVIGLFTCCLIVVFHDKLALIFSSSTVVLDAADKLSLLLATAILLNSIQPILSGNYCSSCNIS